MSKSKSKKVSVWKPRSGIPGVSDRVVAAENKRVTKAETGR